MTETKPCEFCGRPIARTGHRRSPARWKKVRFCDLGCAAAFNSGERHYAWRGDAALATTKRTRRDNRPLPADALCACGAPATDRHHEDGDPGHNAPENLTAKCRRCHMAEDGRLEAVRELARQNAARARKPPRECRICRETKRLISHGRCHACDMFWRRTGRERTTSTHPNSTLGRGA